MTAHQTRVNPHGYHFDFLCSCGSGAVNFGSELLAGLAASLHDERHKEEQEAVLSLETPLEEIPSGDYPVMPYAKITILVEIPGSTLRIDVPKAIYEGLAEDVSDEDTIFAMSRLVPSRSTASLAFRFIPLALEPGGVAYTMTTTPPAPDQTSASESEEGR